ncbi:MAG: flagellar basal body rod protein FlgC [Planctomycetaceae bacterium]|nr:flagellar basal body rod protein FlgC [Planctomycetaceae bacterium]MCA9065774.1 flagellar basal body rod protein FlgC [Planctomycetaceae bacterium]
MSMDQILSGMSISASGLTGERLRMEVAANNIANAHSTQTSQGGPYQRQQVTFAAAMNQFMDVQTGTIDSSSLNGVKVVSVGTDTTEGPRVYDPGHPHADAEGYVTYPNVNMSHEMVDLMTASRAYEANLKSMETFRQVAEQALAVLRDL